MNVYTKASTSSFINNPRVSVTIPVLANPNMTLKPFFFCYTLIFFYYNKSLAVDTARELKPFILFAYTFAYK